MAEPLKGLQILDSTTLLPGPFATMTLADLGAEVLRVVSASRPDLADFAPPCLPGTNLSCATAALGRGKRRVALNLKDSPEYRLVSVSAGAHTREILGELGYREDEIDEFEKMELFSGGPGENNDGYSLVPYKKAIIRLTFHSHKRIYI